MIFRYSTCLVCGNVPPSYGFQERATLEPPLPPTALELDRLWALRHTGDAQCPRCMHRIGLHLGRVAAARHRLGTATDTEVARAVKAPVVLVRNLRLALGVVAPPRKPRAGTALTPERLAIYRDGRLSNATAAHQTGSTEQAVRSWRARHPDELECPPPPERVPPAFYDRSIPAGVVAELYDLAPATVWRWRRDHAADLRPLRDDARNALLRRHRDHVDRGTKPGTQPEPTDWARRSQSR
jgi:hypothetical protein